MGAPYVLERITCEIDGRKVFETEASSAGGNEGDALDAALEPGQHTLVALFVYRGSGFGAFKHLNAYRFNVRNRLTFAVNPGHHSEIEVVAQKKTRRSVKLEDQAEIRFSTRSVKEARGTQ